MSPLLNKCWITVQGIWAHKGRTLFSGYPYVLEVCRGTDRRRLPSFGKRWCKPRLSKQWPFPCLLLGGWGCGGRLRRERGKGDRSPCPKDRLCPTKVGTSPGWIASEESSSTKGCRGGAQNLCCGPHAPETQNPDLVWIAPGSGPCLLGMAGSDFHMSVPGLTFDICLFESSNPSLHAYFWNVRGLKFQKHHESLRTCPFHPCGGDS